MKNQAMNIASNSQRKSESCANLSYPHLRSSVESPSCPKSAESLPEVFEKLRVMEFDSAPSPTSPQRLVQNCGPDCMITQRIVDRLLTRMLDLENERSELLAANRSWALQYQLMKEKYEEQIKKLEDKLKSTRKGNGSQTPSPTPSSPTEPSEQLSVLTHQAKVYKEDFIEERKARARAHAQIEVLRSELQRERRCREKTTSLCQQSSLKEDHDSVFR